MAPACGAQARRYLHGSAGRPARVGVVPAVDRPGALLRHAVRGQHQAVLVTPALGRSTPRRVVPVNSPGCGRHQRRAAAVSVQLSVSNSGDGHGRTHRLHANIQDFSCSCSSSFLLFHFVSGFRSKELGDRE
ncbi:hypothetical protein PR202_gb08834 [Eleusine coracana subsp. coracana]|uniref:Uncharacterized protein n=1 Tax=Eleusine coracana subsp. coracana TaxID=191504 RepID=A0AAV5EFE6_ELECO|nr:hypothetical protein PR202_gb08834 [Eleusine coracana subsp. coracana]